MLAEKSTSITIIKPFCHTVSLINYFFVFKNIFLLYHFICKTWFLVFFSYRYLKIHLKTLLILDEIKIILTQILKQL